MSCKQFIRAFVFQILTCIICNVDIHQVAWVWTCRKASKANRTRFAPQATCLLAGGSLQGSTKREEAMVASLCLMSTMHYKNGDYIFLVVFPSLSIRCLID